MAVVTRESVTTITPTAWKWYAGASILVAVSALAGALTPLHVLAALVLGLAGAGRVFRIVLDPEGFSYRAFWNTKRFSWEEVSDFRINTMRYGLFNVMRTIAFSQSRSRHTLHGKLARLVSGGTHALPVHGIEPAALIAMMTAYQTGQVPADTPLAAPPQRAEVSQTTRRPSPPAPRKPATVRASAKPAAEFRQDPLVQDSASRRRSVRGGALY